LRIVDEALTNVVRHAHANRLVVSISHENDTLSVGIADDGTGFTMDGISPGIGLQSMRERARELGGSWEMAQGEGGRGTTITVRLPAPTEGA
jgi:signal transduction histidine kinase